LATTDTLVEGVHFESSWHPPDLVGEKAMAVNVSDIGAMGGEPRFALLSLAVSPSRRGGWLDAFLAGFLKGGRAYGVTLIGGDTVAHPDQLTISVTVLGEVEPNVLCLRSGARAGDEVWVTGPLGRAAAGLALCRRGIRQQSLESLVTAHLVPNARVEVGRWLAQSGRVHAMVDISDGIATDLAHVCAESRLGAEIEEDLLPKDPLVEEAVRLCPGSDVVSWQLCGGEDYELLFTCPAGAGGALAARARELGFGDFYRLGRMVEGHGVWLLGKGARREITFQGFEHLREPDR